MEWHAVRVVEGCARAANGRTPEARGQWQTAHLLHREEHGEIPAIASVCVLADIIEHQRLLLAFLLVPRATAFLYGRFAWAPQRVNPVCIVSEVHYFVKKFSPLKCAIVFFPLRWSDALNAYSAHCIISVHVFATSTPALWHRRQL